MSSPLRQEVRFPHRFVVHLARAQQALLSVYVTGGIGTMSPEANHSMSEDPPS